MRALLTERDAIFDAAVSEILADDKLRKVFGTQSGKQKPTLAKAGVPEAVWPEFKARATACHQAASPALARLLGDDLRTTYDRDLPSAVACLERRRSDCRGWLLGTCAAQIL